MKKFTRFRVYPLGAVQKKKFQYGKKWAKSYEPVTSRATNANSTVAEEDAPKIFLFKNSAEEAALCLRNNRG